jgi:hypothetical protein
MHALMESLFINEKFAVLIALGVSVFVTWFSIPMVVRGASV